MSASGANVKLWTAEENYGEEEQIQNMICVFPDVFNQTYPSEWTIWINHTESMTHGHVLVKCCSKKDEHNDINKC